MMEMTQLMQDILIIQYFPSKSNDYFYANMNYQEQLKTTLHKIRNALGLNMDEDYNEDFANVLDLLLTYRYSYKS